MNTRSAPELWRLAVEKIRAEIGNDDADLWLKPVEALGLDNQLLRVRVPNRFFSDHIRGHYQRRLEAFLKEAAGHEIALDYQVSKDLTSVLPQPSPLPAEAPQSEFSFGELDLRYTFDTFVVGGSNQFAHGVAQAVAKSPGTQYNPFFVYGGVGLGKTHLMKAIGHAIRQARPKARVLYTTSEQFVNEYIDSIRHNKPDDFRWKHRNLDCLLIDDVQFLVGKDKSEQEFFHAFNSLHDARKQIVLTSDKAPKDLSPSEQRLISRFEWGAVADIKPPDLETRIAILRKKAAAERTEVPQDVLLHVATVIKSNIRLLEGTLTRLVAYTSVTGQPITVDAAKELLKDTAETEPAHAVRIETIKELVAKKYSVGVRDLNAKQRTAAVVFPRHLAIYLACDLTDLSTPAIGQSFGGRDHSTVINARNKIADRLRSDPFFSETVNRLREEIRTVGD